MYIICIAQGLPANTVVVYSETGVLIITIPAGSIILTSGRELQGIRRVSAVSAANSSPVSKLYTATKLPMG
jgi:hypothetical protein